MSTRPALPLVSAASHMPLSATTDAPGLSAQPAWAGVRSESPHPAERTNKKTARSYGTGGLSDRPPLLRRPVSSPAPLHCPALRRGERTLSGPARVRVHFCSPRTRAPSRKRRIFAPELLTLAQIASSAAGPVSFFSLSRPRPARQTPASLPPSSLWTV